MKKPRYISRAFPLFSWTQVIRTLQFMDNNPLSRRFPGAAVVETYRLTEWAHFMDMSCQLPSGILSPHKQSATSDAPPELTPPSAVACTIDLTHQQIAQLKIFYSGMEKSSFSDALEMRSTAQRLKHNSYFTKTDRKVTVTSADMDDDNSYVRNSYVFMCWRKHQNWTGTFPISFLNKSTMFAYVSWFDGPYLEKSSNLYFVFCTSPMLSVVSFSSLSSPYVTAFDDQEPSKLWIPADQ